MDQTTDPTARTFADGAQVPPATPALSAPLSEAPPLSDVTGLEQTRPKFRLCRSRTDKMLGGVCGGLAESLDIDPALLRIAVVALTVLGVGATIPVYAAIWLLAPETDTP